MQAYTVSLVLRPLPLDPGTRLAGEGPGNKASYTVCLTDLVCNVL